MMKQELQDNGLRKALQEPMPYRLPSNFAFRTMQKVEEAVRLKEKKQERRLFFATVAASVCLLAGAVVAISLFWGEEFASMCSGVYASFARLDLLSSPYWMLSVLFLVLLGFDYWMRRAYYKRHQSSTTTPRKA